MAVRRISDSLLGGWERPALTWTLARLPVWVRPNDLTLLGLLGALLTAAGFILSRWGLAWLLLSCIGLVANWLGDSLDGTLARLQHIERPRFGFFVDHNCDLFAQVIIFLSLGISPCTHFAVACLGLIAFLMAFVYTLIGVHVQGEMRIAYWGFGPTEIRALLLLGNLLVMVFGVLDLGDWITPLAPLGSISLHDIVISLLAAAGAVLIAVLAVRRTGKLNVEDPPPKRKPAGSKAPQ
jgi:phosphatidylglycerophosphate synthase